MYYLNILYCNVLSEDSCPASVPGPGFSSPFCFTPIFIGVKWEKEDLVPKVRDSRDTSLQTVHYSTKY